MKIGATKGNSIVMACCAFAAALSFAGESRAYWYSAEEAYSTATGRDPGPLGATCDADGENGMCTGGDTVRYMVSALNIDSAVDITLTPSNPQSWVVSSNDYACCYVSVTCHLGGGATEFYTDEQVWSPGDGVAPLQCSVGCPDGLADDIYVNAGVGIYAP